MANLSGAKHFISNNDSFLLHGTAFPINQDSMPDGTPIPDTSLYVFTDSSGSYLYIKSKGRWLLVSNVSPGTSGQGVYSLVVTGTNTAFIGTNPDIVSVNQDSVYLFSPTDATGPNGANATLTILTTTTNIKKDDGAGNKVNASAGDFQDGITYPIIYDSVDFLLAGAGTQLQANWNQTNALSAGFILGKTGIPDSNAASNSGNTDPDLPTDLVTLVYNMIGYTNHLRLADYGITFNKIRKILGRAFSYVSSSQVFGYVLGNVQINPSGNPVQSNPVSLVAIGREMVPFSELSPMSPISNYYTTAYGGIVGQKSTDTSVDPPVKYECYAPNRWTKADLSKINTSTPAVNSNTNTANFTPSYEGYKKTGDYVEVTGIGTIDLTATNPTNCTINISIPFTAIASLAGQSVAGAGVMVVKSGTESSSGRIQVAFSGTAINIQLVVSATGTYNYTYQYSYRTV